MNEKRSFNYKDGSRLFYTAAICIFSVSILFTLVNAIIYGFTDERIAVILLNCWFSLFTMNIVTVRFQRQNERFFWHDWFIFKRAVSKQNGRRPQYNQDSSDTNNSDIDDTLVYQEDKKKAS